jgi:hypothetical protein
MAEATEPTNASSGVSTDLSTSVAALMVTEHSAMAGPFEPGRLTPTPILAAAADPLPEPPAAVPAEPAAFIATSPKEDRRQLERQRDKQIWIALAIAQHGTATFDAWTTRRVISSGAGHETDPFLRPFAGNASLYAAIQVTPVVLEYLGWRMMRSHHEWERRFWWVPQGTGAALSLASGIHNLGVY